MADTVLQDLLLFLCPGIVFWVWENLSPNKKIDYLTDLNRSLQWAGITFLSTFIVSHGIEKLCASLSINCWLLFQPYTQIGIENIPISIRIIFYYVTIDCIFYAIHYYMHNTEFLWKIHKFHHSTSLLWGMSGQRNSFLNNILDVLPYLIFTVFAFPPTILLAIWTHVQIHNYWMHVNVKLPKCIKYIELFYVTPRYHRFHHLSDQKLQRQNLAPYFTYLDRLFRTYTNPDSLNLDEEVHGLDQNEQVSLAMVFGV